jgi:hypothetical protein
MIVDFPMPSVDRDCMSALSRSYFTALTLSGDANDAEKLVIEAVESLDPDDVTSNAIRDAVVAHLVRAQIGQPSDK